MFQGADVSGLDKMAQKAQDGADYAKKVAMALKILVRALKAMSWTGWAAGYAAYLQATVIPWVEATGEALENFAKVLRMASALQKAVSEDSPQVSIPAMAYMPPQLPTSSAVNAPSLRGPDTAVTNREMPTVSVGDGAVVVIPISIGGTASSLGQTAAQGGGGQVTTPSGVTVSWGGGSGAAGTSATGIAPHTRTTSSFGPVGTGSTGGHVPSTVSVPAGVITGSGGPTGAVGVGASGAGIGAVPGGSGGGSTGAVGGGASGAGIGAVPGSSGGGSTGAVGGGASGAGIGALPGSSGGGSIGAPGASGGGSPLGGGAGSLGSGAGGATGGSGSGGAGTGTPGLGSTNPLGSTGTGSTSVPGDPTVRATPVTAGSAGGGGLAALGAPGALTQDSTGNPAALVAPLGLAGLGAAGLGALRARGSDATDGGEDLLDPADD